MIRYIDNGVSETIGFVIILGIVVTGIALVTLSGYPMLLQQQQNANVRNMEKNMIVLQSEENLLTYKGVPYRETSMQVSGGNLQVINPNPSPPNPLGPGSSNFVVRVYQPLPPPDPPILEVNLSSISPEYTGLLQYDSDSANEIIALQNGAVVTNGFSEMGGSTMLSEPRWFLDNKTLILSLITIQSLKDLSATGIGTVQMNVTQEATIDNRTFSFYPYYVEIQYTDNEEGYRDAWKNYFNNKEVFGQGSTVTETPLKVTIWEVRRIVIKRFNITVLNV
jgi:hypothetical protein